MSPSYPACLSCCLDGIDSAECFVIILTDNNVDVVVAL